MLCGLFCLNNVSHPLVFTPSPPRISHLLPRRSKSTPGDHPRPQSTPQPCPTSQIATHPSSPSSVVEIEAETCGISAITILCSYSARPAIDGILSRISTTHFPLHRTFSMRHPRPRSFPPPPPPLADGLLQRPASL